MRFFACKPFFRLFAGRVAGVAVSFVSRTLARDPLGDRFARGALAVF
jgi:hypothetical protein